MTNTGSVISRIASAAFTLRTPVPGDDFSDLRTLRPCFEGKSIIALGESVHGAREFSQLKHRLIRYLVTELDVRVLGLEMGFTGTLPLNTHLIHGKGNPVRILDGFGWLARTESFLELIEWLRDLNKNNPRSERVAIFGIDIGSGKKSINAVEAYLQQANPDFCREQSEKFELLRSYREWDDRDRDKLTEEASSFESLLRDRFEEYEKEYVATTSRENWVYATYHLEVYRQAREYARLTAGEP